MRSATWRIARFRLARTWSRGWASFVAFVLVIGVVGGVAISSLVGARATQNSYTTLIHRSNPSAMSLSLYAPVSTSQLAKLAGVRHVEAVEYSFNAIAISQLNMPILNKAFASNDVTPMASLDGEYFNQDRVSVVAGRRADPRRADEFMATALTERLLGWHVGQRILMGFYTNAQLASQQFGTNELRPTVKRYERLVGTFVLNDAVVQDSFDRYPTWYLFTPAAARGFRAGPQYVQYYFQLNRSASVAQVEREVIAALPPGKTYTFHVTSVIEGQVNRSIRPDGLALGAFGALALVAALLTGWQLIARRLRGLRDDQLVMRALGASRLALVVDAVAETLIGIVVGSLFALVVGVLLSPLTLLGPVRPLIPHGFRFDVALDLGAFALLVVGLTVATMVFAVRWVPGRSQSTPLSAAGGSRLARVGANAGLSASAVSGLHFAFESGWGRRAVPVRSVLVGVTLAVATIVTTLTFASGLSTLVSRPSLYGWNWDYAVTSNSQIPSKSLAVLAHSPQVAGWSGIDFADAQIDGVTEPILLVSPTARVSPPLLSGHGVRAVDQIVLGAATLADLHKHVGDTVIASYGVKHDFPVYVPPTRLTIVGVATLPTLGYSGTLHPSMGIGAIIDQGLEPLAFRKFILAGQPLHGPPMVLVRFRRGVTHAQGLALLSRVVKAGDAQYAALPNGQGGGNNLVVRGVQYPAEIVNYRSIGSTPLLLALAFASGVMLAFALTITASVRRRRRDFALLKTLGFTRRQLGACIAWQASASVVTGLVFGVPAGILMGSELWILFAHQIYAVPLATVPTVALLVLSAAALALANVVAFIPGRFAARTCAALAFRAE